MPKILDKQKQKQTITITTNKARYVPLMKPERTGNGFGDLVGGIYTGNQHDISVLALWLFASAELEYLLVQIIFGFSALLFTFPMFRHNYN